MRYLIILLFSAMSWAQCYDDITIGTTDYMYNGSMISNDTTSWTVSGTLDTSLDDDWPMAANRFYRYSGGHTNPLDYVNIKVTNSLWWRLHGFEPAVGDVLIFPDGAERTINSVSTSVINRFVIFNTWRGAMPEGSCVEIRINSPRLSVTVPDVNPYPYNTPVNWEYEVENCDDCEIRRRFNAGSWQSWSGSRVRVGNPIHINIPRSGGASIARGTTNSYRFALYRNGAQINSTVTDRIEFTMEDRKQIIGHSINVNGWLATYRVYRFFDEFSQTLVYAHSNSSTYNWRYQTIQPGPDGVIGGPDDIVSSFTTGRTEAQFLTVFNNLPVGHRIRWNFSFRNGANNTTIAAVRSGYFAYTIPTDAATRN